MVYQSLEAMIRAKNQKNLDEGTKKWGSSSKEYNVNVKCKGGHSHDHKVEAFGHEHAHNVAHTYYSSRGHDVLSTSITQPNVMEDIAYDIEEEFIYEGNKAILKKEKKTPAKKVEDKTPGKVIGKKSDDKSDKKPPFAKKGDLTKDSDKKDDDKVPFKKDGDDKSSPFGSKSAPPKKDEVEGNGSKDSGKGKPTPHKNDDTNGENQKDDPDDKVKVGDKTEVIIDPKLDTKLDIDKKDDKKNLIKKEKVSEENLGEMSRKDDLEDIADFHKRKADSAARKGTPDDHHDNQATRAQGLIRMRNRRKKVAEEKLDEISKGKLLNYIEKSTSNYGKLKSNQGHKPFGDDKRDNNAVKRYSGINRASRKLAGTTNVKATEEIVNKVRSIVSEAFAVPGTRSDWLKSMNTIHRLYSTLSIARHGSDATKIGEVIQQISDSWEDHNKKYVMFSEENEHYENRWNDEVDYLFEEGEVKQPIGYHIVYHGSTHNAPGGKQGSIVGKAKDIKRARRIVDKKDNEYGAYVHRIHPVYEETVDEAINLKTLKTPKQNDLSHAFNTPKNPRVLGRLVQRDKKLGKITGPDPIGSQRANYKTYEETEQLDELSKKTLLSYAKKSTKEISSRFNDKDIRKFHNRVKGVNQVAKRLAKEETEQLDEYTITYKSSGYAVAGKDGEMVQGPFGSREEALAAKQKLQGVKGYVGRQERKLNATEHGGSHKPHKIAGLNRQSHLKPRRHGINQLTTKHHLEKKLGNAKHKSEKHENPATAKIEKAKNKVGVKDKQRQYN